MAYDSDDQPYGPEKDTTGTRAPSGAGRNPSTAAGVLVLASLLVLIMARRSFSRYM